LISHKWVDLSHQAYGVLQVFNFGFDVLTQSVFSSPFHPKNFGFWPIILQNGTKHHANFLAKGYPFSILDFGLKRSKKAKKPKSSHPPHEKFGILHGTKHTHENFGILHFIIPK
jgi:hypothetical protein